MLEIVTEGKTACPSGSTSRRMATITTAPKKMLRKRNDRSARSFRSKSMT